MTNLTLPNQPLTRQATCKDCGNLFESMLLRGAWLLRCPTCADIKQGRPTVIVDRGCEFSQLCLIESLPGEWQRFQSSSKDEGCWKIARKGQEWGASWSGRVDIYSQENLPPRPGQVAVLEAMVAVHRRQDRPDYPLEIHEYVRLSSAGMAADDVASLPKLLWITTYSKTTLKGLGAQYKYEIIGSPLWEVRLSGGVRSGRAYHEGAFALVDEEHPLTVKEIFNH